MNEAALATPPSPYPTSNTIAERLNDLEQYAFRTIQDLQQRVDYLEDRLGLSCYPKAAAVQAAGQLSGGGRAYGSAAVR